VVGRLTYSGPFTHISGHPSAASRAQDSESSPAEDQHSTTVPRNYHVSVGGFNEVVNLLLVVYWPSTIWTLDL